MHSQQIASIVPIVIGCIDYLAYGAIFTFTSAMFRPKIKFDVFFCRKSHRWALGGGVCTLWDWAWAAIIQICSICPPSDFCDFLPTHIRKWSLWKGVEGKLKMSLDFFGRIVRWQCLRGSQIRAIEDSKAYRSASVWLLWFPLSQKIKLNTELVRGVTGKLSLKWLSGYFQGLKLATPPQPPPPPTK
jgi:hypothetical protein